MANLRLVFLPWRYKIEWTIVVIVLFSELAFILFDALRNLSNELTVVDQLISLPVILTALTAYGVWTLKRWAFWFMLIQFVLAVALIALIVGAFSGEDGMGPLFLLVVPSAITLWLYWDVLRYSSKHAIQNTEKTATV